MGGTRGTVMNEYYPEPSDQHNPRQEKLVLPAYHDSMLSSSQDAQTTSIPLGQSPSSPYNTPVRPEMLMQNYGPSSYASGKLKPRTSSAAQLILLIAIIVVLIATGSVAYAAVTVLRSTTIKSDSTTTQASIAAANARTSATASAMATPILSPTVAPTAIPTFDGAPLNLTIEDLPRSVTNGDSGDVTVQTNASGVPVHLEVTYAAPPYSYTSDTQVTDASGMATLAWDVEINSTKGKTNAQVVAVAQESGGQVVKSDTMNVRIYRN